jgi:hypothetical protein
VRREAKRLGFARAHEKIAIVDGATWIPPQWTARSSEMRLDGLGLDFQKWFQNTLPGRSVLTPVEVLVPASGF